VLPVVFGVICIVAVAIRLIPGDPIDHILGDESSSVETRKLLEKEYSLNLPVPLQIMNYMKGVLRLDLGKSMLTKKPVWHSIRERIVPTLELAVCALLVSLLLSIPLGLISAMRQKSIWDFSSMIFSVLGVALPNFWLGPMLVLLFSVKWNVFPVSERGDWRSYILPSITLGTALCAVLTRMLRSSLVDEMGQDYVRTARAKGLSSWSVVLKHVFKNSSIPVLTIVGLQFGVLLTGSIITEKIFDWPGLGTLIIKAIEGRDYPVVQGCVLFFSLSYIAVNFITDLSYAFLDPRIRLTGKN